MSTSTQTVVLNIHLKSSALQTNNFKQLLKDHIKLRYVNTSYDDRGFITKIQSVRMSQSYVDHVTAELSINCICKVSLFCLDTDSVIPIKLSIVKNEAMRGEMVGCENVQVMVLRKGLSEGFQLGDIIETRPSCVRYEPEKVSCHGVFVRKAEETKKRETVKTSVLKPK
jgi:hypothetical protein